MGKSKNASDTTAARRCVGALVRQCECCAYEGRLNKTHSNPDFPSAEPCFKDTGIEEWFRGKIKLTCLNWKPDESLKPNTKGEAPK